MKNTKRINLTTRRLSALAHPVQVDRADDNGNTMLDPRYLRQSSSLIQDALQKGFDVLQLANGDIIMTGTKTVVHQYVWDTDKGRLAKAKSERKPRKLTAPAMEEDDAIEDLVDDEA